MSKNIFDYKFRYPDGDYSINWVEYWKDNPNYFTCRECGKTIILPGDEVPLFGCCKSCNDEWRENKEVSHRTPKYFKKITLEDGTEISISFG